MNKNLRTVLIALLVAVFLISTAKTVSRLYGQRLATRAYKEAVEIGLNKDSNQEETKAPKQPNDQYSMTGESEENTQKILREQDEMLSSLDLGALRETNEDVLGWIYIPDTVISYPLMRCEDNSKYLKYTWDLKESAAGSIFLERSNSPELNDFNTIIYGHNMKNGTMFSPLHKYKDKKFLDSHPYVYIATEEAILQYEVFSAYKAELKTETYRAYFRDEAEKQRAIDYYIESSEFTGGVVPCADDRILTLSTCTGANNYSHRWVVHGVLVQEFPRGD